jgi:hypothetical protein
MTATAAMDDPVTTLPVASFTEAAPFLRRPFTAAAVKFKVQATWPKGEPTGALVVAYIDSRLVVERLNMVCPGLWSEEFQPDGKAMWCHLTIDGITRRDIGTDYIGKGLVSDARKRAAVQFGVGVSLYASAQIKLNVSDGHLKPVTGGSGKTLALTPRGEGRCRELYAAWLASVGEGAFGAPLDHGDVEDSQGDPEQDEALIEPETVAPHGPSADADQLLKLSRALAFVLGEEPDSAGVDAVLGKIADASDGYVSVAAMRAVGWLAAAVKAKREPVSDVPIDVPDQPPDEPVDATIAAGSVEPPDLTKCATEDDARAALREAGCTCPNPLGPSRESAGACPIAGHGVPW